MNTAATRYFTVVEYSSPPLKKVTNPPSAVPTSVPPIQTGFVTQ